MPIVREYDISSVDKVKEIIKKVDELQESRKYDEYTKDDIILVRTTNIFPKNGVLEPLCKGSLISKTEFNFICNSLRYQIDEKELKSLASYSMGYRSTTHLTENGLVLSHPYGNFRNQSFIFVDPLNEHLDSADFRCFAGHDIFVKGGLKLSEKAIVIIKKENYDDLLQKYPELINYNVVLYTGISLEDKKAYEENPENVLAEFYINDERAIVEQVLMDLGYTPELIGTTHLTSSPTSEKLVKLNEKLATERNVCSNTSHCYTPEYKEDKDAENIIDATFDNMLLDFILNIHKIDRDIVTNSKGQIQLDTTYQLINLIGLEELIKSVELYNQTIEYLHKNDILPSSLEILNGSIPNIYQCYLSMSLQESDTRK